MADKQPPEDALSDLRRRVDAARSQGTSNEPPPSAASLSLRIGGEFGAAIIVGALLGYGADYFLHSSPWGLVIGFGLGFATGVVNVVRAVRAFNNANPPAPNARPIPDDDD